MSITEYDFTKSPVNSDQLAKEIQQSAIVTALDHVNTAGSSLSIFFKNPLSEGDQTILGTLVSNHVAGTTVVSSPKNPDGVPIVEAALRRSTSGYMNFTIVTHDFSDRTTWYQKSVQVTNEVLTDSGNGLFFNSANPRWINMKSLKLTVDYKKVLERDGTLTNSSIRFVVMKSNGTTLVEGTDYTVDYPTGVVTFTNSQTGNTITASYWHNNGVAHCSEFLFTPPPNTQYRVEHIEAQFSKNTAFNDVVQVEIWAGAVTISPDQLTTSVNLAGYGGFADAFYDAGYGQSRTFYRNMNDLINWCNNQYPLIPACGALTQDIMVFPFLYIVHPVITVKQGVVVRLYLKNDTEMGAEICTVCLYMEKGPAT